MALPHPPGSLSYVSVYAILVSESDPKNLSNLQVLSLTLIGNLVCTRFNLAS